MTAPLSSAAVRDPRVRQKRKPRPRGRGEWGRVRLTVTPCRISPDGAVPRGTRQRLSAERSTCPNGCNEKRRMADAPRGATARHDTGAMDGAATTGAATGGRRRAARGQKRKAPTARPGQVGVVSG